LILIVNGNIHGGKIVVDDFANRKFRRSMKMVCVLMKLDDFSTVLGLEPREA
jgi:hypothetical protein